MKLFIAPHNDDETLFGTFTILREKPLVVIVYDSYVQAKRGLSVTHDERRLETLEAMNLLGVSVAFLGFSDAEVVNLEDIVGRLQNLISQTQPVEHMFLPAFEPSGHAQHNQISKIGRFFPGVNQTQYLTYTTAGKSVKEPNMVKVEDPSWIIKKHQAMACYFSQMNLDPRMGCWPHFMRDIYEYYA